MFRRLRLSGVGGLRRSLRNASRSPLVLPGCRMLLLLGISECYSMHGSGCHLRFSSRLRQLVPLQCTLPHRQPMRLVQQASRRGHNVLESVASAFEGHQNHGSITGVQISGQCRPIAHSSRQTDEALFQVDIHASPNRPMYAA